MPTWGRGYQIWPKKFRHLLWTVPQINVPDNGFYRKDKQFEKRQEFCAVLFLRNLQYNRNGIENNFAHSNFPWKWDTQLESTRIKGSKYIGNLERS